MRCCGTSVPSEATAVTAPYSAIPNVCSMPLSGPRMEILSPKALSKQECLSYSLCCLPPASTEGHRQTVKREKQLRYSEEQKEEMQPVPTRCCSPSPNNRPGAAKLSTHLGVHAGLGWPCCLAARLQAAAVPSRSVTENAVCIAAQPCRLFAVRAPMLGNSERNVCAYIAPKGYLELWRLTDTLMITKGF